MLLSLKTDVSTAPLFNIVKVLGSKTNGPAILHCKGFQRYTVRRPTALLLYVPATAILHCEGSLLLWYPVRRPTSRRPGCCYCTTSDLLPPIHFANALCVCVKQHRTCCCCCCPSTLWTLSTTCCCYCCSCTSIAIYW